MENQVQKIKPRILCLHGHGSNAMKLENQVKEKWPESVLEKLNLLFLDAPFPIDVEGTDPPHYEWFHADQDFKDITKFDECMAYLEDNMVKHGPFDGILGFSQCGFRTNAKILEKLVRKWPDTVLEKLDLVFLDAPFPAEGPSEVEGIFYPPFYEWFHSDQGFREYRKFEEWIAYIENYMIRHGPFDGILGYSQGALLSAALPGIQLHGAGLSRVLRIKFLIIISGAKFGGNKFSMPKLAANAFFFSNSMPICPLHRRDRLFEARGNCSIGFICGPNCDSPPQGPHCT